MIDKKQEELLMKIFITLELGEPNSVTKYGNRNDMYKVTVKDNVYVVKEYDKDVIHNELEVNGRKLRIAVCESLSQNGVPAIIPHTFDNRYFIRYRKTYFLIYDYLECAPIKRESYDAKKIKKVASTLAIIHKLNFKSSFDVTYNNLNIDLNEYLEKFKKIDDNLYNTLYENNFIIEQLIKEYNEAIKYIQNYLCISFDNYGPDSIYWKNNYIYLVDYNNVTLHNPSASLAEVAFNFALEDEDINEDIYKEFITAYTKKYGLLVSDYQQALPVAARSRLLRLIDCMDKCNKNEVECIKETVKLIKELSVYHNYIERFYELYLAVVKK